MKERIIFKNHLKSKHYITAAVVAGAIILSASGLIAAESHFNYQEIQSLVDGAEAAGYDYELVIHDQLTNSYSFSANE